MKVRRRFLLALVASLLLHLGIVTAPGWSLPSLDDLLHPRKPPSIDAWLATRSQQLAAAPAAAKPRKRTPAKPKPSPNAVEIPNMPVSASAPPEAEPAPEPTAAPEAPPVPEAATEAPVTAVDQAPFNPELLALHLRINYAVTMGEQGLIIGQAIQEMDNDGVTYRIRSTTETTGLARLFKRVDLVHTSEGDIVDGRLRPREFTIERDGSPEEWARFDWNAERVTISRERTFALEPGTEDMLSVFCELALIPIAGPSVSVPVVTGKKVERYDFAVVGEERLTTPMGDQPTLHLRTVGTEPEATDIWLGLKLARLPVRIRHVDRNGEVFDQLAGSIDIEPTTERPH